MRTKNTQLSRIVRVLFALCVVIAISSPLFAADSYPTRPIRFIIPYPPGGGPDVVGRLLAPELSKEFGQQAVMENRPGGGAIVGTELVAKSAPDGYTVLIATGSFTTNPVLQKLPFDTVKDFTPIVRIGVGPNALVVNPNLPAKTIRELIALCKQKLGSVMAPKTVDFVASLPRSTVGKVLKKDLREQYWQESGRKV